MSSRLTKRMLQETASSGAGDGANNSEDPISKNASEKNRRRKNERKRRDEYSPPAGRDELVESRIRAMLFLDRKMASKSSGAEEAARRIVRREKIESRTRQASSKLMAGNSRDASSKLGRAKREPTVRNKAHREKLERRRLRAVARLLKKNTAPR